MCGPSGCGKTTWARKYLAVNTDLVYISRDEIRFKLITDSEDYFSKETSVFTEYKNNIQNALARGQSCIADATHLNDKSRQKLLNAIKINNYNIIFVVFTIDLLKAIQQNNLRQGLSRVPERIIKWQFSHFTVPVKENYYNCKGVWIINGF